LKKKEETPKTQSRPIIPESPKKRANPIVIVRRWMRRRGEAQIAPIEDLFLV
jgi:hypothetical protein